MYATRKNAQRLETNVRHKKKRTNIRHKYTPKEKTHID